MANKPARQIAALPYRIEGDGSAQVMLITSRETKRWVIPKGNPIRGLEPHEAAAEEAFEEAGLDGICRPTPIGIFHYDKRLRGGVVRNTVVRVFPLLVTSQAETWPELAQRECQWFPLAAAAMAVDEPELQQIIANFRPGRRRKKGKPLSN